MIWTMLACSQPEADALAVFDDVWSAFDERYGPFDQRGIDWDGARDEWRPTLTAQSTDAELWDALTGMLAETNDGHVQLYAPDREHWFANDVYRERIGDERFDRARVRADYLGGDPDAEEEDVFLRGRIGGAAYVWFGIVGPWVAEVEEARADAETGLIVDLRHNFGGDFTFVRSELADWTEEDVPVFRSRTRNGPDRGDFDAWTDWAIEGAGAASDVPVVVLTDRYTLSAGERTTMMFRALPGVTVIGEPTNGSISTMIGQELVNGWYVTIPVQEVEGPGGEVWEGVGIPPELEVLDDLATPEDEVLEAALALLE